MNQWAESHEQGREVFGLKGQSFVGSKKHEKDIILHIFNSLEKYF